jgi:hypothetical protein
MNKRDFIVHGGGTLLAGAVCLPAMGRPTPTTSSNDASASATQAPRGQPRQQQDWQALQGQVFDTQTTLGRPVQLALSLVSASDAARADNALAQFTVTLQGPRALPLQAGLHMLHHPDTGPVALYLEPVAHGEQITYDAHFSLRT